MADTLPQTDWCLGHINQNMEIKMKLKQFLKRYLLMASFEFSSLPSFASLVQTPANPEFGVMGDRKIEKSKCSFSRIVLEIAMSRPLQ